MIVGYALFRVKKGKEKTAFKHMRHHLKIAQKAKGFIHGYIAKSLHREREYLVIEEYETPEALQKVQDMLVRDSKIKPNEYSRFSKVMQEKPRLELYRKEELTEVKLTGEYKKVLKKLKESKLIKKEKAKKKTIKAKTKKKKKTTKKAKKKVVKKKR